SGDCFEAAQSDFVFLVFFVAYLLRALRGRLTRNGTLLMSSHSESSRIGMGCMRLSTERDRDETRAIEVLHAALDLGVTFLDTADAYCLNDSETGHNERLIAHGPST